MRRILAGLLLLLAGVVNAQTCWEYKYSGSGVTWHTTLEAAFMSVCTVACPAGNVANTRYYPEGRPNFPAPHMLYDFRQDGVWSYNQYHEFDKRACQSVCTPGEESTVNVTEGYNTGLHEEADRIDYLPNGAKAQPGYTGRSTTSPMCVQGCFRQITGVDQVWISDTPTPGGMYRISVDWKFQASGSTCTATAADNAALNAANAPPECPGTVGNINGKTVCVPKDSGDRNTVKAIPTNTRTKGNPQTGTDGTVANIPTTGSGSNSGGPKTPTDGTTVTPDGTTVTTGTGTTPDGTKPTEAGKEQQACGAPGQPACKLDEKGTPTGQGAYNTADTAVDGWKASVEGAVNTAKTLQRPAWTWTFQLPTGCSPFVMEAFELSINPCNWQTTIHPLMGVMWIMAAIFLCLRMVFTTFKGG